MREVDHLSLRLQRLQRLAKGYSAHSVPIGKRLLHDLVAGAEVTGKDVGSQADEYRVLRGHSTLRGHRHWPASPRKASTAARSSPTSGGALR